MLDLIFKNGTIYDGSGESSFVADIGITGDTIRAIGDCSRADAE